MRACAKGSHVTMTNTPITLPIGVSGTDPVPLVVWTTAEQVVRLQAQVAQLLAEQESAASSQGGAYAPPHSNTFGPKDAWSLPAWTGSEEDAAAWIVDVLGSNQRRVLAHLVSAGPEGVWTGELRRRAGYDDSTSMSGVFKAIGGRFRSTGLRPVWNGGEKDPQKGQRLRVFDDNARALFLKVVKARHPDLAKEYGIG